MQELCSDPYNNIKKEDKVNHPSHYTWLKDLCGIEVIDITRHMNFNLGNVIKYVLRAGHKSEEGYLDKDKETEDLKKAKWYLEDEIYTRTKQGETDKIQDRIKILETHIANLVAENKKLKMANNLGEFRLTKSEVEHAAKILEEHKDVSSLVKFIQYAGSGIGIGTSIEFSTKDNNQEETIVMDITDYGCW